MQMKKIRIILKFLTTQKIYQQSVVQSYRLYSMLVYWKTRRIPENDKWKDSLLHKKALNN